MSGPTDVATPVTTGTVGYEKKINCEARGGLKYENDTASIYLPFEVVLSDDAVTEENAKRAFLSAKAIVLTKLGVKFNYDAEKDDVVEVFSPVVAEAVVTQAFPGAQAEPAPQAAPQSQPQRSAQPAAGTGERCPKCDGDMYDNRQTKKSPRQPDYRCKKYRDTPPCDGVIWPPKGGS